jgi:hypothetical protein
VSSLPLLSSTDYCAFAQAGVTYADYAIAVPSNRSDPLYLNWSKPEFNPIINGTSDDPSTAWQTEHGEWRLIGNSKVIMLPLARPLFSRICALALAFSFSLFQSCSVFNP